MAAKTAKLPRKPLKTGINLNATSDQSSYYSGQNEKWFLISDLLQMNFK